MRLKRVRKQKPSNRVVTKVEPLQHDNKELEHGHSDLPEDHPHLIQHHVQQGKHVHAYIIDDLHQRWPK